MEPIINKIHDGIHIDHNEYDQPENTMSYNQNGIILDLENGNYQWTNMKGTTFIFQLSAYDQVMSWCWIRQRGFIITLNSNTNFVRLVELGFDEDGLEDFNDVRWQGDNAELNLSHDHPIRAMWGFYENDEIQRIYWTDWNNQPRVVNIKSGGLVDLEEKFANFFPRIDGSYGTFRIGSVLSGGVCRAGTYFFAWRFFKEGYYTDWSYLTTPVHVTGSPKVNSRDGYQENQGQAPNENTNKRIRITLIDIDTDYDSVQIAYFYSNDFNSAESGSIFYDGDVAGVDMTVDLLGNENLGTVTIDDLIETSILIEKAKDMRHIKKWNVMANVKERDELDFTNLPAGKNNQIHANVVPFVYRIPLDTFGYPQGGTWTAGNKALFGILQGYTERLSLRHGQWYRAYGSGCTYTDDDQQYVMADGEYFMPNSGLAPATIDAGQCYQAIVIRKYKKASAGPSPDINDDYEKVAYDIYDDFYNYKHPTVNAFLKGYPSEELIRLGILYLDKTGRPFFTRWINNQDATYGQPDNGDTRTPKRTQGSEWGIVYYADEQGGGQTIYNDVSGAIIGLRVSGIDVTSIRDKIGGFMIVRAPIVHEHIAYGVLGNLHQDNDDIYQYAGYIRSQGADAAHYAGAYSFLCPEDIYQLRDFSIQPGDKLVNHNYMQAFDPAETAQTGCQGFGREEMTGSEGDYSFYQKFYLNDGAYGSYTPDDNGLLDVEHEVLFYTRHEQGDTDETNGLTFDPRDPVKELQGKCAKNTTADIWSFNTTLGIVVLDIDEVTDGWKGIPDLLEQHPTLLVCSVKRDNSNPYGGTGDSSLSNTQYIGTGHFQKVDDAVLADVVSGGNYIFDDIDVFGGDTYICMFDIMRLLQDDNEEGPYDMFNHSIIVPMETRINLEMREGRHVCKDRSYDSTNNPLGIRRDDGTAENNRLEEFSYNDGYSSENIEDYYIPLPYNFQLVSNFDSRLRYSNTKTYNELEDSFRKFGALSILDLDTHFGQVNAIRRKFNRMVYWQRDAVGYIPIQERALSQTAIGEPVQLGVGGIFERHDEVIEMVGCSNQFGIAESPLGFHWYDAIRKIYLTLTSSMKFSHESLVKGMDRFFANDVSNDMDEYDNPILDYGVLGGYDPRYKMVYTTFFMPSGQKQTIGYNVRNSKFIGFFNFWPRLYFEYKDWMYSLDANKTSLYQHSTNELRGTFHDIFASCSLEFIVKAGSKEAIMFDRWEMIASQQMFVNMAFDNTEQSAFEFPAENRNYKFRNRRWYGNFPTVTRERLVDGWLRIRLNYNGTDEITFNEFKTFARKMI